MRREGAQGRGLAAGLAAVLGLRPREGSGRGGGLRAAGEGFAVFGRGVVTGLVSVSEARWGLAPELGKRGPYSFHPVACLLLVTPASSGVAELPSAAAGAWGRREGPQPPGRVGKRLRPRSCLHLTFRRSAGRGSRAAAPPSRRARVWRGHLPLPRRVPAASPAPRCRGLGERAVIGLVLPASGRFHDCPTADARNQWER